MMQITINKLQIITMFLFSTFLLGCAEIQPPTPEQVMRQPLGESPLRIGMTKEKVQSIWGEPDLVRIADTAAQGRVVAQGTVKEEWIYRGRYPNLPINVDYLSETQHLFFDGSHLVRFYHSK
ncbi:MAG: hypothetical protein JW714_02720 [Candidatus Omnitrophica bacterium]|nr:hypothetical protein [Candidatus Omnitrophota bacterium]